jgi:chromosomal replication initiator protein
MAARREEGRKEEIASSPRTVDFERVRREARVPDEWGFDRLVVTASNRLPYAAARELAGQENPRFSFLFLCGDYGLGKTAMLRAMYAVAAGPEKRLDPILISAEDWCNEYYHAIQKKTTRQFRRRYRNCDMLLMDDVQFVQGKEGGQRELMHTVKHVLGNEGRVALAGKPHPDELRDLDPGFRALLKRAFPAVILPPSDEEKLEIVKNLAGRHGLRATEEVHRYVARQKGHSFGAVDSAVCCLAMYAGVHGSGRLELAGAMDAFAAMQPAGRQQVGLDQIKNAVLEVFDIEPERLTGRCRSRTVLLARQVGMFLARELTGASLSEVARFFGRKSHSTVKHAVEKIEALCQEDSHIAGLVRRLERRLSRR